MDQHLNTTGYLEDLSRICLGSLKDHTEIIMGSKCNYTSMPNNKGQCYTQFDSGKEEHIQGSSTNLDGTSVS